MLTSLPAGGFFVINAKVQLDRASDAGSTVVQCTLTAQDAGNAAGPFQDMSGATLLSELTATIPLATAAFLPSGGTAVLNCVGNNVVASNVTLVAIQVENLTRIP